MVYKPNYQDITPHHTEGQISNRFLRKNEVTISDRFELKCEDP